MRILYFSWLRTKTGLAAETAQPPSGIKDVKDLVAWIRTLSPGHAEAFAHLESVRMAVNQEFAGPEALVKEGDEVAFFPPVTGGGA
jgi:molybdopterin synthase sulfur carrier subunit